MADKDAVKGSPEVPLTEEDAAHLAETLEVGWAGGFLPSMPCAPAAESSTAPDCSASRHRHFSVNRL